MSKRTAGCIVAAGVIWASGCRQVPDVNAVFEQLAEASAIASDLSLEFTHASDAANRAVMADTDERSVQFAQEAEQAFAAIKKDTDALRPLLERLDYQEERQLLERFIERFQAYHALEQNILGLAVENTNLKAHRLSFGPGQDAVEALRQAVEAVTPARPADAWHVKALAASVLADVREIQVLEAPHIAESTDEVMAKIEKQMTTSEAAARTTLKELQSVASPTSRSQLDAAGTALDRFVKTHQELLLLSRRNTNVRSLALSLEQKRELMTPCEESLRALRDTLAKRRHVGRRWP